MKYFREASSEFLTEALSYEEFDKILKDGECLPVSQDFEDWDPDYLEKYIKRVAKKMQKAYNEAVWDAVQIMGYDDVDFDYTKGIQELKIKEEL